MKALIIWLLSAFILAALMVLNARLDAEREAVDLQDEINNRDVIGRMACGENAAHAWVNDTTLQCYTHRGHKTKKVSL